MKCQKQHWKYHKKVCSPPIQKLSAPVPPQPSVPLKVEEVDEKDRCIICMDREVQGLRPLDDLQGVYGREYEERHALPTLQEADVGVPHWEVR